MATDIEKLRKQLGLNRAEFAVKLGVAENTIRRWEAGKRIGGLARRLIKELFQVEIK